MIGIIGIDEAGRGCWAGPLVAAAVLLKKPLNGLADSKKLTRLRRESLYKQIMNNAEVGVGVIPPKIIDKVGLTEATTLAMTQAVDSLANSAYPIIIDGNINYLVGYKNVQTIIKADTLVPAVSAASIIAKVTRDNYMIEASFKFPVYKFHENVGYGTAFHISALAEHGICELHRLSYKPIKAYL